MFNFVSLFILVHESPDLILAFITYSNLQMFFKAVQYETLNTFCVSRLIISRFDEDFLLATLDFKMPWMLPGPSLLKVEM